MGLSCFRAISGMGMDGMGMDGMGWDLCAGLFYEHRFAMLITSSWIGGYNTDIMYLVMSSSSQGNKTPYCPGSGGMKPCRRRRNQY